MDTVEQYRRIIENIITQCAGIPYTYVDIERQPVFDRVGDHYLLMLIGREGARRVHGSLIHVDIRNGKFWIQRDGTEYGIARELLDAGVPKEHIVLAFKSPELRRHTDFAVT